MSFWLTLIFFVCAFAGGAMSLHEEEQFHCLHFPSRRVMANQRSATMHATTQLTLPIGRHTLTLCDTVSVGGANATTEQESLQVMVRNGSATVQSTTWRDVEILSDGDSSGTEDLTDDCSESKPDHSVSLLLTNLQLKLKNATTFLSLYEAQDTLLTSQSKELVNDDGSFLTILMHLTQQRLDLLPKIAEKKADITELTSQIRQLRNLKEQPPQVKRKAGQLQHVAQVSVHVAVEAPFELYVQYVVGAVSWRPQYEVLLNTTTNQMRLNYNAILVQHSRTSWENVSLVLSTGEPVSNRALPTLNPWLVELVKPEEMSTHHDATQQARSTTPTQSESLSASVSRSMSDVDQDHQHHPTQTTPIIEAQLTSVSEIYTIPGTHTVPPNQQVIVKVATIVLDVNITRTASPSRSRRVFMQVVARNKSPYTMLEGPSFVYIDGVFEAKSSVPWVGWGATMSLDIGLDQQMTVSKKEVVQTTYTRNAGWTNTETVKEYEYLLVVNSKRSVPATITIIDQVPRSLSKDLKAALEKPVKHDLYLTPENVQNIKTLVPPTNNSRQKITLQNAEIVWTDVVVEDGLLELPLRYTMEFPSEKQMVNK